MSYQPEAEAATSRFLNVEENGEHYASILLTAARG